MARNLRDWAENYGPVPTKELDQSGTEPEPFGPGHTRQQDTTKQCYWCGRGEPISPDTLFRFLVQHMAPDQARHVTARFQDWLRTA